MVHITERWFAYIVLLKKKTIGRGDMLINDR